MRGTPQQPNPAKPGMKVPIKVTFDEGNKVEEESSMPMRAGTDVRRVRITPAVLAKYGYTEGCEGCRYKRAKMAGQRPHSEECRKRIMEALEDDEDGKKAKNRYEERVTNRLALEGEEIMRREAEAKKEEERREEIQEKAGVAARDKEHSEGQANAADVEMTEKEG